MYQRLVQYKNEHGDCLVPRKYDKDPKLSVWVDVQRSLHNQQQRSGTPTASTAPSSPRTTEQKPSMSSLQSIQLDGQPQPEPANMEPSEPSPVGMETDSPLGFSSENHAQQALLGDDKNKAKRLTPERKQKLDELGFVWSLRTKRIEDHWDTMFRQLVAYKEQHGDCLVPSRYEANLKLAKWVETQRQESRKASDGRSTNPRLTEDRIRRLESIGFEWKVKQKMKRYYDKQWDGMFERLKAFKEANGHCMVPKRYNADPRLGVSFKVAAPDQLLFNWLMPNIPSLSG
jgi:Helicase associated domain